MEIDRIENREQLDQLAKEFAILLRILCAGPAAGISAGP